MNPPDLIQRMNPILEGLMRSLEEEHGMATQNARTVTLDQSSVGRLSRMDAMQQQAMAQASLQRLGVQRRRVEAALDRVRRGSYGQCCECGGAIGLERLLSDPAAPFCMDCQEDRDAERDGAR
ncbi:MAG: TraR/DksA C4-type zinc finger protein [Rubrivivax sp.]|nr:TraR/DksA C4-type zinc finger protein [Rubrivivax sp.]